MRHTWDSICEHLGLPASAMPTSPANTGTGFDTYTMAANMSRIMPDGTPMDAREMMLAEMTSALNPWLGLAGDANIGKGQPATSGSPNGK
jgi:hypothetical protein